MSIIKNYRHRGVTHPLVIDRRIKQAIESAFKVSERQSALPGVKIVVCHAVPCRVTPYRAAALGPFVTSKMAMRLRQNVGILSETRYAKTTF